MGGADCNSITRVLLNTFAQVFMQFDKERPLITGIAGVPARTAPQASRAAKMFSRFALSAGGNARDPGNRLTDSS